MDTNDLYFSKLDNIYKQDLLSRNNKSVKKIVSEWIKTIRGGGIQNKTTLTEIFTVKHTHNLKLDLIKFLHDEFSKGNITSVHSGPSTVEYKPDDWLESLADNIINQLIHHFETIRGQTERDAYSQIPISQN